MHAALMNISLSSALVLVAGLLMVLSASTMQQLESKQRTRWCAACHRPISGRNNCTCSIRR